MVRMGHFTYSRISDHRIFGLQSLSLPELQPGVGQELLGGIWPYHPEPEPLEFRGKVSIFGNDEKF
jgi:hypothetical protein